MFIKNTIITERAVNHQIRMPGLPAIQAGKAIQSNINITDFRHLR
tara:strand:- start:14344 stop:14478 length:135 start_codon:yes stop_codon:yes gene_type:complete